MNRGYHSRWIASSLLACSVATAIGEGKQGPSETLNSEFQIAVSHYNAGQFAEAAAELKTLLPRMQKSFEVHELLGLSYAAQSMESQAAGELQIAVELNPASAAARTNLAAALYRVGRLPSAEEQFRKAIALDPHNYEANHDLAELYTSTKRLSEAIPYLKASQAIQPSYDGSYNLALAYFLTGDLTAANAQIERLLRERNTSELHNLLGQIDEKKGLFVEAANEFGIAAHMDPSEENLFAWGGEMLLHRSYEPAIEILQQATVRYPQSSRLFVGLGMALYSRGRYDEAVSALMAAVDLKPGEERPYFFLSKAFANTPIQADAVIGRFKRYAELEPGNARATYFYAAALWKAKRAQDAETVAPQVEGLLQKAIALDPNLVDVYLQLGSVHAERHEYDKSIAAYRTALKLSPDLPDAHYRLGQDYIRTGQKDLAQAEIDVYQKQRAQHLAEVDRERAEVKQFVYGDASATKQ